MNSTQQLEAIERLVGYSGLEEKKAREYLEMSQWNVDAAYRLHKSKQMRQQGFQKANNTVHGSPFTEPMPGKIRPVAKPTTVYSIRPMAEFAADYGTLMSGMGPAVVTGYPHGFAPPRQVPKFPVETPSERIIPIQVETRPRLGGSETFVGPKSVPPPTSKKPLVSHKQENWWEVKGEVFPKSQSYPTPATKVDSSTQQQQLQRQQQQQQQFQQQQQRQQPQQQNVSSYDDNSSLVRIAGPQLSDTRGRQSQVEPVPPQSSPVKVIKPPSSQEHKPSEMPPPSSTPKVLKRGISKISENAMLVDEERKNVLQDIVEDCHDNMYVQMFVLPDVTGYNEDFRAFLEKELIETATLVSLEQAGRLNWWAELGVCQRLLPMATSGDGNCLLHAASLAMWGIHDRQLMLRKALHDTLTNKWYRKSLYRRWRWQQTQANKEADLIFNEVEWQTEWDNVLRLASTTPRSLPEISHRNSCCDSPLTTMSSSENNSPVVYESLEEFHVFVLAHVLQRPIIVVADTILRDASGDALAPIPFGGIYLPLECEASHCYRSPLMLTYDAAHFSALVPMEKTNEGEQNGLPVAIPIVSPDLKILPLHFSIDPGESFDWEKNTADFTMSEENKMNLMTRYMDLEKLTICGSYADNNSDDKNSTGSYESDDGFIDRSKKKDNRVSQQLHSVSKQFGSFGKSVGKKLKNLGKGSKEDKKTRKVSLTQSTKVPLTIAALSELEQFVSCCRVTLKKSDTHQKMIDNYLYDAGERFKKDVASRRLRNNEIVTRVNANQNLEGQQRVPCVTSGCNMYGTLETSYLCAKCFSEQKQQLLDQEKDLYKSFENKAKQKAGDKSDETKVGLKSKFYDMKNGETSGKNVSHTSHIQPSELHPKLVVDLSSQNKGHNSRNFSTTSQNRTRTPSPDYDNVDYVAVPPILNPGQGKTMQGPASPKPVQKGVEVKGGSAQRCRNSNCDFYGSSDTDFYCSSCYKNRHTLQNIANF